MAGNLCKPIRGVNLNRKSASQYGYVPSVSRGPGKGPGEHYVFPDLFGDGKNNAGASVAAGSGTLGLSSTAAITVVNGQSLYSAYYDLSGWQRWTIWGICVGAGGVAGTVPFIEQYADPAFNVALPTVQTALTALGGGGGFRLDSQGLFLVPYLRIQFFNSLGIALTYQANLFCYNYPG